MADQILYFAAQFEDDAARVIDSGPIGQPGVSATVPGPGIDPAIQMANLEEILTARSFDDIAGDDEWARPVAEKIGGDLIVVTLTDSLTAALAATEAASAAQAAARWSQAPEFAGQADPDFLLQFLRQCTTMASQALAGDAKLYCWVSSQPD